MAAAPVLWLTGLSGAGKTTIAQGVAASWRAAGLIGLVLDGDVLRRDLCADLGFSMQDRSENLRRAAAVAALAADAGIPVIAALISPLIAQRELARDMVGADRFLEVHVHADLHVLEARDTKGLYAKARRGELADLTGIGSAYEPPQQPALRIDTSGCTVGQAVERVRALALLTG